MFYRSGWLRCVGFNCIEILFEVCGVLVSVYVLTPHVLSEWMVEVCRFEYLGIVFEVCGVLF